MAPTQLENAFYLWHAYKQPECVLAHKTHQSHFHLSGKRKEKQSIQPILRATTFHNSSEARSIDSIGHVYSFRSPSIALHHVPLKKGNNSEQIVY